MINKLVKTTILGASFWKFALLFAALFMSYSFSAHAQEDGETPADATPVADAPAEEPEAGPVDDYLGLVEAQGEYGPAYDFFTTSMLTSTQVRVAEPGAVISIISHATMPTAKQMPNFIQLAPFFGGGGAGFSASSCSRAAGPEALDTRRST